MERRSPGVRRAPSASAGGAAHVARRFGAGALAASFAVAAVVTLALGSRAGAYPAGLNPSNGAYFGARVEARSGESDREAINRLEGQIGRRLAIDHLSGSCSDPWF